MPVFLKRMFDSSPVYPSGMSLHFKKILVFDIFSIFARFKMIDVKI
jgi:hypothetical protein